MTDDDKDRWSGPLVEYYTKNKGMDIEEAESKIKDVFIQAESGWNHCPRDIDTRIKMKTGFQWKGQENLNPIKSNIPKIENSKEKIQSSSSFIYDYLDKTEKSWWDLRMIEYSRDFDFNDSSDKPLIVQLLFEELIQRRLFLKQLKNAGKDYSKSLTESLKRVTELQTKLGITREQRSGLLDSIDGNVADISMNLDKKLEMMPKEMKVQYDEELRYQTLKNQRPPINILPGKETMMAIINKDPSENRVEVSNQAAQDINEIVSKNRSTEKPKSIELPDGERLQ